MVEVTAGMALSKPLSFGGKINKLQWSKSVERKIHDEEIMVNCYHSQEKAVSVELIHHLMGGPNMEYKPINIGDSFECFNYCADHLICFLKKTKSELLFFEHWNTSTANIIVAVIKQNKTKNTQEHPILFAVIRLTIMMTPLIGFCRYFELKGQFNSLFYQL